MSYDVSLEIDTGGPEPVTIYDWNYTSNCAPMWRAAGADLAAFDGRPAAELAVALTDAVHTMRAEPARFEAMNPSNGWGSAATLARALNRLRETCEQHPRTTVRVDR